MLPPTNFAFPHLSPKKDMSSSALKLVLALPWLKLCLFLAKKTQPQAAWLKKTRVLCNYVKTNGQDLYIFGWDVNNVVFGILLQPFSISTQFLKNCNLSALLFETCDYEHSLNWRDLQDPFSHGQCNTRFLDSILRGLMEDI